MRESARAMWVAGALFLALGAFLFVVTERITVKVELLPISFILILMLVAGAILFGSGVLMHLSDRF